MWQVGNAGAYGSGARGPDLATETDDPHRDQASSATTQSLRSLEGGGVMGGGNG